MRSAMSLKAIFTVLLLVASSWAATEKTLHNFGSSGTDGQSSAAGLIFDSAGNLYGTTAAGGAAGKGTVFETSPDGSGGWTTKLLWSFGVVQDDGQKPVAGLVFDAAGNLYGTTYQGGTVFSGTVFELSPNGDGTWAEKVLHHFQVQGHEQDGKNPAAGLIFDAAGNLYGTTYNGGTGAEGTVFELSPNGDGTWAEKVIHNFFVNFHVNDGQNPQASVIFDAAGNLYGTTYQGGSAGHGAVFEMSPNGSGGWTEKLLHSFWAGGDQFDGSNPEAGLIFDAAGNLYGTTYSGGSRFQGLGTVFEMTPDGSGGWTEKVLHVFHKLSLDGKYPQGGVIFDGAGNLYGTTSAGGTKNAGAVFEMTPNGDGSWAEFVLHNFQVEGDIDDGANPLAGVIFDSTGNLYGTTSKGGTSNTMGSGGVGTVFQVAP